MVEIVLFEGIEIFEEKCTEIAPEYYLLYPILDVISENTIFERHFLTKAETYKIYRIFNFLTLRFSSFQNLTKHFK